ncbi:probable serine/threonine-protein kinase DDB_G0268876 [Selaginella moellendorffii]|uniref:probable serine/threonine-protein kinase DDB_G0268876 n=1 Tax=Selaginella moellendorffii TaxID=88036 RepID=UPI000D1CE293|nr:probable serine/threonine-protein kinase DDB_G0268876 [Selaginella moellendorffii]|eukprot:XP_024519842.1 probable serine/threonine-protein kinase DDB_G0268876 [Selaginella moellendorffii]
MEEESIIHALLATIDHISEVAMAAQVNKGQIFVLLTACGYVRLHIDLWSARCSPATIARQQSCFQQLDQALLAVLRVASKYSGPDWIEKPWLYVARENAVVFEALLDDLAIHVDLVMAALLQDRDCSSGTKDWIGVLRRTSWENSKALRCGLRISASEDKTKLLEILGSARGGSSVATNMLRSSGSPSAASRMDWIDPSELELDDRKPLGQGSFGLVFQTTWAGHTVAVKKFPKELWSQDPWEGEIMVKLRPCHPSVLQILGWSEKDNKAYLVMELMQGSLARLIPSLVTAPIILIVEIMLQIAQGMDFVHKKKIIHRDLKPGNVLVNFDGKFEDGSAHNIVAKVADFGLSKMNFSSNHYHSHLKGTVLYMAPEMLEGDWEMKSQYDLSVDVYSYGMMFAEILTGTPPYPLGLTKKALLDEIRRGLRPRLPQRCPQALKDTIAYCWDSQPRRRPTFEHICTRLWRLKGQLLTGGVYCMPDARIIVKGKLLVGEKLTGQGSFVTDTEWSICYWVRHQSNGKTVRLLPAMEISSRDKSPEYVITGCDYDSSIELVCISVDSKEHSTTTTCRAFAGYGGSVDCDDFYKQPSTHFAVKVFEDDEKSWKGKLVITKTGLKLSNRRMCSSTIWEPYNGGFSVEVAPLESSLAQCVVKGEGGTYRLQFDKWELRDLAIITIKSSIYGGKTNK